MTLLMSSPLCPCPPLTGLISLDEGLRLMGLAPRSPCLDTVLAQPDHCGNSVDAPTCSDSAFLRPAPQAAHRNEAVDQPSLGSSASLASPCGDVLPTHAAHALGPTGALTLPPPHVSMAVEQPARDTNHASAHGRATLGDDSLSFHAMQGGHVAVAPLPPGIAPAPPWSPPWATTGVWLWSSLLMPAFLTMVA